MIHQLCFNLGCMITLPTKPPDQGCLLFLKEKSCHEFYKQKNEKYNENGKTLKHQF